MRVRLLVLFMAVLSLSLGASLACAQMGGGQGGMMQPNQMQRQSKFHQPDYGPAYGRGPRLIMGGGFGSGMPGYGMGMGMGAGGGGMMGMMMGHMMGGYGGGMMDVGRMLPYLDLSPRQWEKVRYLAYQRLEKMAGIRSKLFQQQLELFKLAGQPKVDAAGIKKVFIQQAELNAELFLAGLDYLAQVEKVLTQEQKKQLKGRGLR